MRIIPKKTKVRIELFKGMSLTDLAIAAVFSGLVVLVLVSDLANKLVLVGVLVFLAGLLLVRINDEPNYQFLTTILRHLSYRHDYYKDRPGKEGVENITSFTDIKDDMIVYGSYYGGVLEVKPVEYRFLSNIRRQTAVDDCFGGILRALGPSYSANIVKLDRRVPYDSYLRNERDKLDELRLAYENAMLTEQEFQARCEIVFDRMADLERLNEDDRVVAPYYYVVLYDSDKNQLRMQLNNAYSLLERGEMRPTRLDDRELALFLKYSSALDFDERELDNVAPEDYARWAMPNHVSVRTNNVVVDDVIQYTMAINNYPLEVGEAWLAGVMSVPSTKVVVKMKPMDRSKTIRNIDHSIAELRGRYAASGVDSTRLEIENHIETLSLLLEMLQSDREVLLNTDIYVTCYDIDMTLKDKSLVPPENSQLAVITNMRKTIRRFYRESELRLSSMQFDQTRGYLGSQISGYDPMEKNLGRGIPSGTLAASFPWIYAHVADPKGIRLGSEDGIPVFIDMFRRDSERVNSNVVIVGKSGSGKSYAAKSILSNLAADDAKIFVLDPENEYTELAANLHGKFINVGNASQGRINPFHIITTLDGEEGETSAGNYATHLQFLEEFFRQILPDCEKDALEYLNSLVDRVYTNRGITAETNFSRLAPEDYPTFDDLYDTVLSEFQSTENDYLHAILRTLINYISKFSSSGRNASLWNGPSTITTEENFTVFNFQSLLAGGNQSITNAQMLLVLKYIDNEIIKNRDFNERYGLNRRIVVVIDEAHVFIDEKYPIALDFMFQLAKRIRKYNGMQIVITQNIKDFVGSEDVSRKSSAIINACQYSFIFPLSPNDMSDLCKLYEKAGGISEVEQDKIMTSPRGNAFVVLGPTSHSSFQVEVPQEVVAFFKSRDRLSEYFAGEAGLQAWEDFIGDSRVKYEEALSHREVISPQFQKRSKDVFFSEVTEEEYELQQAEARAAEVSRIESDMAAERSAREAKLAADKADFEARLAAEREMHRARLEHERAMAEERAALRESLPQEPVAAAAGYAPSALSALALPAAAAAAVAGGDEGKRQIVGSIGQAIYDTLMHDVLAKLQKGDLKIGSAAAADTADEADGETGLPETVSAADSGDDELWQNTDFVSAAFDPEVFEEVSGAELFDALPEESEAEPLLGTPAGDIDIFDFLTRPQTGSDEEDPDGWGSEKFASDLQWDSDGDGLLSGSDSEWWLDELPAESGSGIAAPAEGEPDTVFADDDGLGGLDIMSMLNQAVSQMAEKTVLERMEEAGELTRTITLEELVRLVQARK